MYTLMSGDVHFKTYDKFTDTIYVIWHLRDPQRLLGAVGSLGTLYTHCTYRPGGGFSLKWPNYTGMYHWTGYMDFVLSALNRVIILRQSVLNAQLQRRKSAVNSLHVRLSVKRGYWIKLTHTARRWGSTKKNKTKNIYLNKLPNISAWKQTFFRG